MSLDSGFTSRGATIKVASVPRSIAAASLAATAFAFGASNLLAAAPHAAGTINPLATTDQRNLEALALRVYQSPAVQEQKRLAKQELLADPAAQSVDGSATLDQSLEEWLFAAVHVAVNGDPTHPKIFWTFAAPHSWFGTKVPGSRYGSDNPDNDYRFIPVDGTSKYQIKGRQHFPGPAQFSFLLYDYLPGVSKGNPEKGLPADQVLGGLRDQDIKVSADGTFTITIDSDPDNGRANHIRSAPSAKFLLIRDTLPEWSSQIPNSLTVTRTGGPKATAVPTEQELDQRVATLIATFVPFWLNFDQKFVADKPANQIQAPAARGGGWGFAALGRYQLAEDEGLLITLDPLGGKYLSLVALDPWLVSRDYIGHTGNLNSSQAKPNTDGTFTYVVAATDPGIRNWLDTSGLHTGALTVRWQNLPATQTSAVGAIREVKVVKLAAIKDLPALNEQRIVPSQRTEQIAQRRAGFARRIAVGGES